MTIQTKIMEDCPKFLDLIFLHQPNDEKFIFPCVRKSLKYQNPNQIYGGLKLEPNHLKRFTEI